MDPTAEITEIMTALGGLLGGAATLITVLRRHPEGLSKSTRSELEALQQRLEHFLTEEEGTLGKPGKPNGATTGC